jgi:hypothetical protein
MHDYGKASSESDCEGHSPVRRQPHKRPPLQRSELLHRVYDMRVVNATPRINYSPVMMNNGRISKLP